MPSTYSHYRPCNFFYNVSGDDSERLLIEYGEEGDFLARPSESTPTNFTLSVKCEGDSLVHVKVQNKGEMLDLYGGESFKSLSELVDYYIRDPQQLMQRNGVPIVLRRPISIPLYEPVSMDARAPTAQRWFHSNITGAEATAIVAKEKPWTFLIRESQTRPCQFAITVKKCDDTVAHIHVTKNAHNYMYHVGAGDEFLTIDELLDHYSKHPLVEEGSENVVHLHHLIPSTCMPADAMDERLRILQSVDPVTRKSGFTLEYDELKNQFDEKLSSCRVGKRPANVGKNRYRNILPYDHSRVILNGGESDYINASYVKTFPGPPLYLVPGRTYITTQGCLENTVKDFWNMVWQENSRVIVMMTKEVETGKVKCHKYFANVLFDYIVGDMVVRTIEEEFVKNGVRNEIELDSYVQRKFLLMRGGEKREIFHMQFVGWPDHGAPDHPAPVLQFMETVEEVWKKAPESQGPVVVHCSAGIGRTGTFIMLDILLHQLREQGPSCPIDIPALLVFIRRQRNGLVQTDAQYIFLHKAVSCFISSKSKHPSCAEFTSIYLRDTTISGSGNISPRRPLRLPDPVRAYVSSSPLDYSSSSRDFPSSSARD